MLDDLRYSIRSLSQSPLMMMGAILTLALGIGANSAVFAVVEAVLLRPLPYAEPDRLVRLWETNADRGIERGGVSQATFVEWSARSRMFERIAVFLERDWLISVNDEAETVRGAAVSPGFFPLLGVDPQLGRTFGSQPGRADREDPDEVVISHSLWQRAYGGRPDVIGQVLRVEGRYARTVIGVMPSGFSFPEGAEAWWSPPFGSSDRTTRVYEAIGRMKAGVALDSARADIAAISRQLEAEQPGSSRDYGARIELLHDTVVEGARTRLLVIMGVVALVLLIAGANVTGLLLARAASRRHDVAVRLALGARWTRVLRQSIADSVVLTSIGAGLGGVLGFAATHALIALAPADIPRLGEVYFGGPALVFSTGLAFACAFLTALPPVLESLRVDIHDTLMTGGRGTTSAPVRSLRAWLIGGEVALTLVLLIGCTLLLRSFVALRGVDAGFEARQVLTADLRLATNRFAEPGRRPWFALSQHYDGLIAALQAMPGVAAVGGVTVLPLSGNSEPGTFWFGTRSAPPDASARQLSAELRIVTPRYFDAMSIPLRRGRVFTAADRLSQAALSEARVDGAGRPRGVVVVNEAFVRRYLPAGDPLGRSIVPFDHDAVDVSTIVGVVADVRDGGLATPPEPTIYIPFGEMPGFRLTVAVRTADSPERVTARLKERLRRYDPQMLVSGLRPMDVLVGGALSRPRFTLLLVMSFAMIALGLSAVGIYGIVALLVASRTREIGVRMALGAGAADVMRLVLRDGLSAVTVGVAVGCALALVLAGAIRSLLFGIVPLDPTSFAVATGALVAVAVMAAAMPARRACLIDPTAALRQE